MDADWPRADGLKLIIAGYGASGSRLARLWRDNGGGRVIAFCRHPEAYDEGIAGLDLRKMDLDAPRGEPPPVNGETVVVWLAPPPREGVRDTRLHTGLSWLLAGRRPCRLVYVSTTGVYGAATGWIGEDRPVAPDTDRARRRADAEEQIRAFGAKTGVATVRLRVAGIYGPGRLPEKRLRTDTAIDPELARRPGNRIHVDDLVRALYLAALRGGTDAVYNVADEAPAPFGDYLDACADHLGLPRLIREEGRGRDPAAGFLRVDRFIDSRRLREELGLELCYPDYRVGLAEGMAGSEGKTD